MGLLSPTVLRFLPHDVHHKVETIKGHLLPNQYILISKLMKAVKKAGIKAPVLNNSWPDIVNPMLWRNDLGPLSEQGILIFWWPI